jgi:hypothetical protein
MTILKQLLEALRSALINKTFWIGFVICFAMFSRYIFGDDNLLEQIGEQFTKQTFGIDIDFSPGAIQPNALLIENRK